MLFCFQTHPEKKVKEEEKEFDALIHSHGFLFPVFVPPRQLLATRLMQNEAEKLPQASKQTSLLHLFPLLPPFLFHFPVAYISFPSSLLSCFIFSFFPLHPRFLPEAKANKTEKPTEVKIFDL